MLWPQSMLTYQFRWINLLFCQIYGGADVCPMEVLILEDEKLTVNEPDECSYCESCVDICPNECITIE